jgi:hypothetical protein
MAQVRSVNLSDDNTQQTDFLNIGEKSPQNGQAPNGDIGKGKDAAKVQDYVSDDSSSTSIQEVFDVKSFDPVLAKKMSLVNQAIDDIGMTTFQWKLFFLNGFGYAVDSVSLSLSSLSFLRQRIMRKLTLHPILAFDCLSVNCKPCCGSRIRIAQQTRSWNSSRLTDRPPHRCWSMGPFSRYHWKETRVQYESPVMRRICPDSWRNAKLYLLCCTVSTSTDRGELMLK